MAYPVKAICENKDIRIDGTCVIYLQYYAKDGKRRLNTGLSVPPKFWNNKERIIKADLPIDLGSYKDLNREIIRQHRLVEDLIQWAEDEGKNPIGTYVAKTFRPNLNLHDLKLGIHPSQSKSKNAIPNQKLYCLPSRVVAVVPYKPVLVPIEKSTGPGMIFPNLPADSSQNGRPWPNVFEEIEHYIKDKTGHVDSDTLKIYKNMGEHLRKFEIFRKEPISFLSFNFTFYEAYKKFLTFNYVHANRREETVGMKRNSIYKTIKHLRLFIKDRVKRQIIPPIDMSDFKTSEEELDAIYLSFDEIARFYRCDLSKHPELINDQKLLVLACLTGLRFSDYSQLSTEDYRDGKLYKKTDKKNKWVVVPLRDEAKEILQYFIQNGFPKTDNSSFNANIKEIGKYAGIIQPITFSYQRGAETIDEAREKCNWITSHTGRRSFCTNEFLAGTPVKLIMSISGHKKEKDFYKYICWLFK